MSYAQTFAGIFNRPPFAAAVVIAFAASVADGQPATRDLSGFVGPNTTFTVTVSVNLPGGTQVAGYEDAPPTGWVVSNISDSGSFDVLTQSVKWGPYLEPSIPTTVSYDVTTPGLSTGSTCFDGSVSFDGSDDPIEGDLCAPRNVPASSGWSLWAFGLFASLVTVRTVRCRAKM